MALDVRKPDRKRRALPWLLGLGVLVALGAVASRLEINPNRLILSPPIEYVRVEGSIWHLDAEEFRASVAPYAGAGYFRVDLDGIEAAARRFAWVAVATAERVWPDTVVIRIEEQHPIARWGKDSLLNGNGERFTPKDVAGFENLPLLEGPLGQEKRVLEMLRVLNGKLRARQQELVALTLSKRLAWVARTTNGMEIVFGNQDPLAALDRLLALLPQLGEERIMRIQKLDLRYPNGFSVVWKQEALLPPATDPDLENKLRNG